MARRNRITAAQALDDAESNIPDYRGARGAYATGFKPMTHQQVLPMCLAFCFAFAPIGACWRGDHFCKAKLLSPAPPCPAPPAHVCACAASVHPPGKPFDVYWFCKTSD